VSRLLGRACREAAHTDLRQCCNLYQEAKDAVYKSWNDNEVCDLRGLQESTVQKFGHRQVGSDNRTRQERALVAV
jgi:hypothetical protein